MQKKKSGVVDWDYKSQELEERKNRFRRGGENVKYGEEFHTKNRPEWIVNLYLELDRFILALKPGVRKEYLSTYIKYSFSGLLFTYIVIRKGETLRVWAKVPYSDLGSVPLFVRDYSETMHRPGIVISFDDQREFTINKEAMLNVTYEIIKKAFNSLTGKRRRKTPLKLAVEVEPVVEKPVVFKAPSVNLTLGEDDYVTLVFKVHKSNKKMLDEILEKIIYE